MVTCLPDGIGGQTGIGGRNPKCHINHYKLTLPTPECHPPAAQAQVCAGGLSNTLPFRIVWGTPRSCCCQVIKKAVCALLPNSLWELIEIKKSLRQRGSRWIWWYTIIALNEVITMIDQVWHSLEQQSSSHQSPGVHPCTPAVTSCAREFISTYCTAP